MLLEVIFLLLLMLMGNLEGRRVVSHVLVLVALIRLIIGQVVEEHVVAVPCTRFFHFMLSL